MSIVYIIGAGPGDPGLISARGVELLALADVVVYDRGVEAVLRWARPDAERIAAGGPAERETAQAAISMLIAEKARDGHTVARLKWGDAFVFDSGGKEALFLHEQGVPFEVVPGIPAAFGATAYAGIPVTYPGAGDAVVLLRGREDETLQLPEVDWAALTRIDGTIVCYVGARLAPAVLKALLDHGKPADSAAALILDGTLPTQRTLTGTIKELLDITSASLAADTAVLVVGQVTKLRDHLRWFDERVLFGKRIVVTRAHEQERALVDALEHLGAQTIEAPTFRIEAPEDPEAIDRAAASIADYRWVVFESAMSVTRFFAALTRGPRDVRALASVHVCAIGQVTADRLVALGVKPDVVAAELGSESFAEAMAAREPVADRRVLVVRADHARDVISEDLGRRGALVTDLVAYRTTPASPDSPVAQRVYRMLLEGQIDAVTFTSPTAVRRFTTLIGQEQAVDLLNTTVVVAIGPVTAAAAAALGISEVIVPSSYTLDALVQTVVKKLTKA